MHGDPQLGEITVVIGPRRGCLVPAVRTAIAAGALAGLATAAGATGPQSPRIAVRLTGFEPQLVQREADGAIPVRWSTTQAAWLSDKARCHELWSKAPIDSDPGWQGLPMHSDAAPDEPMIVRTCAEWHAAVREGRYAMSSMAMDREVACTHVDGMLAARAAARPSARSRFMDFDLAANARFLLPIPAAQAGDADGDGAPRWRIGRNHLHREDDDFYAGIEPVLFGDLDGDGWEDMLARTWHGATQGTLRTGSIRAFTWIGDGPLVEITCRLPRASARGLPAEVAPTLWREAGRIAPLHEFSLEGNCGCGGAEHKVELALSFEGGIASGTVTCAGSRKRTPVLGCLGERTGILHADTRYDGSGFSWRFDWALADGQLTLDGDAGVESNMERARFSARGTVLTPDERMRMEGWRSELRFRVADSNLVLRRSCGSAVGQRSADALCLESGGVVVELARLDRIEWGDSTRDPEADPAADADIERHVPRSVYRTEGNDQMLLLSGWSYGASTNNPMVIAVPIRDGRLCPAELQVFALATVALEDGVASVQTHDLRAGADPYRDHPAHPSVTWRWKGRAWSDG